MGAVSLDQILVTPLKRILVPGGDVLHALKRTDEGFRDFGEAYFSSVEVGAVKAWKLHRRMTLNLVVPVGEVRVVFFEEGGMGPRVETIGVSKYARLTVPPKVWFGFQGLMEPFSLILIVADIPHEPEEVERKAMDAFDYDWGLAT